MSNIDELTKTCLEFRFNFSVLNPEDALKYSEEIIRKYNIWRTTGHLQLADADVSLSTDRYEFTFSRFFDPEPAYIFFDQHNYKKDVFIIEDARNISEMMENSYGMEYFISNKKGDFIIAVNWYTIQGKGKVVEWMQKLKDSEKEQGL